MAPMGAYQAPRRKLLRYSISLGLSVAGCGLVILAQQLPPVRSEAAQASVPSERPFPVAVSARGPRQAGWVRPAEDLPVLALGSVQSLMTNDEVLPTATLEPTPTLAPSPSPTTPPPEVVVYQVQPGDNLWIISQRFGLEQDTVVWANAELERNPDQLQIGQEIYILPTDGVWHTVSKGETLASIAQRYKVDAQTILNYPGNDITDPATIKIDQKLIIPGGVKPAPTGAAAGPAKASIAPGGARLMIPAGAPAVPVEAPAMPGRFLWPASGVITQGYHKYHGAIDIANNQGTPLIAPDGGTVTFAAWSGGLGNAVQIDHGDGFATTYGHLHTIQVQVGQRVERGQQIGLMGTTGHSTGPHLHFIVTYNGGILNPMNYLP